MDQVDCHQCQSREMNAVGCAGENAEGKQPANEKEQQEEIYVGSENEIDAITLSEIEE